MVQILLRDATGKYYREEADTLSGAQRMARLWVQRGDKDAAYRRRRYEDSTVYYLYYGEREATVYKPD